MSEADYAALIAAAHRALDAPVIVVWDNLNTHRSKKMRAFTDAHADWLTVIQPARLRPRPQRRRGRLVSMKSSLGNHAATTLDQLEAMVRSRLRTHPAPARPHQRVPRPDRPHPRPPAALDPDLSTSVSRPVRIPG